MNDERLKSIMTIEFDKRLNMYTVFFEGDEAAFKTKEEAQNFINEMQA